MAKMAPVDGVRNVVHMGMELPGAFCNVLRGAGDSIGNRQHSMRLIDMLAGMPRRPADERQNARPVVPPAG
jgi:hypothetical protein